MSGSKNYGTATQWNTTQQKERRTPTFSDSMDGTGEYCAKRESQVVKVKYHAILPAEIFNERCSQAIRSSWHSPQQLDSISKETYRRIIACMALLCKNLIRYRVVTKKCEQGRLQKVKFTILLSVPHTFWILWVESHCFSNFYRGNSILFYIIYLEVKL